MKIVKWIGIALGVLCVILLIGVGVAWAVSARSINKTFAPTVAAVAVPSDSAALARGRHIVEAIAKCVDCHGQDLGGTQMIDNGAFGRVAAPNITRGTGSRTLAYADVDWVRAIRHAVKPDGRPAAIMPAESFIYMSDADLGAVIAYAKSVPPVDRSFAAPSFGPVARALMAAGKLPIFPAAYVDHTRSSVRTAPSPDTTVAYGDYLTQIGGCRGCHNQSMSGGPITGGDPNSPPAANLTPGGIGGWEESDFVRLLRTGKRWHSEQMVSDYMPWRSSGKMTDDEIHAIWLYLQTLPSRELGQH
jgi:mono/diheme cytochrome c family protein